MLRAVMDTNVLYSALRSRLGASFDIFLALRDGRWRAVLSNHLLHEYEEVLKAAASELSLSFEDIDTLLDAICARAEEWQLAPGWIPILRDPDDEPLVQLAYDSRPPHRHSQRARSRTRALPWRRSLPPRDFAVMLAMP